MTAAPAAAEPALDGPARLLAEPRAPVSRGERSTGPRGPPRRFAQWRSSSSRFARPRVSPTSAAAPDCLAWSWRPACPDARVDLIESVGRKCEFLREAIERMGLGNASVVCGRSEEWAAGEGREAYDAVTARAVGPPRRRSPSSPRRCSADGGVLVAWKGARSADEEAELARAADRLAMEPHAIRPVDPYPGSREPAHPPASQEWTDSERTAAPARDGGEAPVRLRTALTRTEFEWEPSTRSRTRRAASGRRPPPSTWAPASPATASRRWSSISTHSATLRLRSVCPRTRRPPPTTA